MIQFQDPPVGMPISQYMELVKIWKACSSCTGFCIKLGQLFFTEGVKNVDEAILPLFTTSAAKSISPRVLPSYAILYWFSLQVNMIHEQWCCDYCNLITAFERRLCSKG